MIQVGGTEVEVESVGLNLGHIQHIANKLEQQLIVLVYDVDKPLLLVDIDSLGEQVGESHNGIQRRAYLVAHVGEEGHLKLVGLGSPFTRRNQHLLLAFALGNQQHRPYQHRGHSVIVAFGHGGTHLNPLNHVTLRLPAYKAILHLDILQPSLDKAAIYITHALHVVGMYAVQIILLVYHPHILGHGRNVIVASAKHSHGLAHDFVLAYVPAPRYYVSYVHRHVELVGKFPQITLGITLFGYVDGKYVYIIHHLVYLVAYAYQELVGGVGVRKIVGEAH